MRTVTETSREGECECECVCVTDSLCYTPETNTTLKINYTAIKIIF